GSAAPTGPRAGSPPDGPFHRLGHVLSFPEVAGQVFPAAVGEDADDDALLELAGELPRDVRDRAGRDTAEDPLRVEQLSQAGDGLLVRDEDLPVELRDVESRRHVAVLQ